MRFLKKKFVIEIQALKFLAAPSLRPKTISSSIKRQISSRMTLPGASAAESGSSQGGGHVENVNSKKTGICSPQITDSAGNESLPGHGEINFLQRFNPVTGKFEWFEEPNDYDFHQEIARSAYADMLHDHDRNIKYYEALKIAIKTVQDQGKEPIVLDIGTGTGLLSMMAAKCGASKIFACEAFTPMLNCAKEVVKRNNLQDKISLISKRSTDLKIGEDLPVKANILVTEVFDTELIGEGAISTYNHAIENLLTDDCIAIPSSATIFAQVVECDLIDNWNTLQDDNKNGPIIFPPEINQCYGVPCVQDAQISEINPKQFVQLSDPLPIFDFQWTKSTPQYRSSIVQFTSKGMKKSKTSGVFMWWDLKMDLEGKHIISCKPQWIGGENIAWRDHWMMAIYYLNNQIMLESQEPAQLISFHDEYSLWFKIDKDPLQSKMIRENESQLRPTCTCGFHTVLSRSRISMLNDQDRNEKFAQVFKKIVKPNESICLCISDFSLLPFILSNLGAKYVFILETNKHSAIKMNELIRFNKLEDKIKIICKSPEDLQSSDIFDLKIDIVFGDPYFNSSVFPWHNLLFLYSLEHLRWSFSKNVHIIPNKAQINAIAIDFEHLWKIKAPVRKACDEFDLQDFDNLILNSTKIADTIVDAQPLWEYPGKALSEPFNLYNFNFEDGIPKEKLFSNLRIKCSTEFGKLNGIGIWIDWLLTSGDDSKENMITTGIKSIPKLNDQIEWDIHSKQGVILFWDQDQEDVTNSIVLESEFDPGQGELNFLKLEKR